MNRTSIALTCSFALAGAIALGAQTSETKTTTKIEVEHGKNMKVIGCIAAHPDGGYVLTEVEAKGQPMHTYMLVSSNDDFAKMLGHRVQIEGKVGDRGDGKVEIKTETKVDGPAKDTHSKTEFSGAYLGVKHVKMVAGSCG